MFASVIVIVLFWMAPGATQGPSFDQAQYTTSETDSSLTVCFTVPFQSVSTPVQFIIVGEPGTATRGEDYTAISIFGEYQGTPFCVDVSGYVLDDITVEGTETFTLTVVTQDSQRDSTIVHITDNDGATFQLVNTVNTGFGPSIFSVTEGNMNTTFPVCAELIQGGDLQREAVLLITTMEGAADTTDFLVVNNKTITFSVGSINTQTLCADLVIFGDLLPEPVELFTFSLATANPLDMIEGTISSTVIIQNDDATPDCGVPPDPGQMGVVMYNSTLFGAAAVYMCDEGYQLEPSGGGTRFCLLSGNWSGADVNCTVINCNPLISPSFGVVMFNQTTFGEMALYTCLNGYQLVGVRNRTCTANGLWSGTEPTCQAVDCGALQPPTNGVINFTSTTFNNTASYSCDTGYELVGNQTRTCLATGNWSGSEPSCNAVDCGPLDAPSQGQVLLRSTLYFSLAVYSCNTGYTNVSEVVRMCEANGQWSGVEPNCTDINECEMEYLCAVNASCTNTEGGFNCSCLPGFKGNGTFCQDINECSSNLTNCSQLCENNLGSYQCTCEPGFRLRNDSVTCVNIDECAEGTHGCHANARCTDTVGSFDCSCKQVFSGDGFNCTAIDCGPLDSPLNGSVLFSNLSSFNSTVNYMCDRGFNVVGTNSRVCTDSGEWSGSQPLCQIVDCGLPPNISMGSVLLVNGSTVYQSQAVYQCTPGYVLANGDQSIHCLSNGLWSGLVPSDCLVDGSSSSAASIDVVVLSSSVSVAGFALAVILLSVVLLLAVRRVHKRTREKVYGVDTQSNRTGNNGADPTSLQYIRPVYDTLNSNDLPSSLALSDWDPNVGSTEFLTDPASRPTSHCIVHESSTEL